MKKKLVLFFAMLASIVVLAVGFTIGSSAQTYDVSTASDFTSKINSAASGDTINVTADITVGTAHTITKNLTVTSSNGSTVTATVDNLFSVGSDASTSGNLTIDGNLTLTYPTKGTIVRMVNGTLTVQGNASLISSWTTVRMATDDGLVATSHVYVKDNALVEATIDNENDYPFYVNGVGGKANLHIQGGTVRHTAGYGISFPAGNIEISGGTLTAMYGIFVWYDAGSATKTINVSGGVVEGSQSGIYFRDNTKNCTLTVSGGTVRGDVHAIHYVANKDSSNNAININGGTVTAAGQTIFLYRCTALPMTVTGGTIEATSGGLTIYGAELKGDLTLNVSGTAQITATGDNTINVTMPGNTSTYPGKLAATISGGTISAGGEHAINVQNGSVTMTGGTVSASSAAIYANKEGGTINISGGTVTSNVNTIAFDAAGTRTLNISGTAQIISTGDNAILGTASATPTITISGGTITADGNFCIDTRGGTVNISNGTLTANSTWGFYVRGSVAYTITGGKLTAPGSLFGFSGATGASLNITGGTFILSSGDGNGAFVAKPGSASGCTITIGGGLFVDYSTANIANLLVAASLDGNFITVDSCRVLYKGNVTNIITGIAAPKTDYATYDANGNGVIDSDETFYVYDPDAMIPKTFEVASEEELVTAFSTAASGSTVDVVASFSMSSQISVIKAITLTSSNSSTITATADNIFSVGTNGSISGNLTIEGNLTILSDSGTIVRMVNGTLTVQGNANLTSNATTIRMASDGGVAANCYVYIKENALIEATSTDESDNVMYVNDGSRANLYIEGGTVRNTLGRGISFPGGKITVSGGTLTAKYGIYAWYGAGSAIKTITVSGGVVEGSITGIYFNTNAKNCTLTVSGGTVCGNTHAIDYRADQNPSNNSISISGGTLTAESQAVFLNRSTAVTMNVTGGTIESTNGGNTIYGAELRGDLTLNVSGSPSITATDDSAVVVVPSSNYPGKLVATIGGGTFSANNNTFKIYTGSVTMTAGTISATGTGAIHCHRDGGSISISGGTVSAGSQAILFAEDSGAKTLNISGTAKITAGSSTVFLYRTGAVTMTVTGGTIEATTGGNTIYGAELKGNLILNISGSPSISAAQSEAIVVTVPGNTSTYPGKLAATISGGTISAGKDKAINVCHGSVSISGGTVSAPSVAIYMHKDGGQVEITGGTVTAESSTIVLNEAGARTLTISGTAIVRATSGDGAITSNSAATPDITIAGGTITASGDFCLDTKGGTVNISGGTLTSGGYTTYLRGTVSYTVTGGKLTAGANAVFAVSSTSGVSLNISGGTFILNGEGEKAKVISEVGTTANCTITIDGGLFINNDLYNDKMVDYFGGDDNEVTINSAKMLYKNNIQYIAHHVEARKTAYAVYDANGNGKADDGETYYLFVKYPSTDATCSGAMQKGASVRLGTNNGIRFTSDYSAEAVAALNEMGSVTYGTIILPTTYLAAVNAFTIEALNAAGITYVNIVAADGLILNSDGSITVRAALTDLNSVNFSLSFSAVSYALVDGTYYYTAYNTADNARTMQEIAQAAMDNLSDTQIDEYQYAVTVNESTKYSPYTATQRTILQGYISAVVSTPLLAGKSPALVRSGNDTYQYCNKAASLTDYNNYKTTLANAGYTLVSEKVTDSNKVAIYTGKGKVLTLSFTPATTTLRFLMEAAEDTALPTISA